MSTGFKLLIGIVGAIIMFICLFVLFPMILEGVHTVNQTTNITQYYALAQLNRLSPSLLFAGFLFIIFGTFAWVFRDKIKERFFGGR